MCRHSRLPKLSDDLIISVLLKVPVKSLLRFTSVSKPWYSSIKNPRFIKFHIDESSVDINRQKILFISSELALSSCLQFNRLEFRIYTTGASLSVNSQVTLLDPPLYIFCHDFSYPLVSSCNGILCLVYSYTIMLWNPAIRKYKSIPKPDHNVLVQVKRYESALYGFAYDSVSDDYKIVATFVINAKRSHYVVQIYSVNHESWRKIDDIPAGYRLFDINPVSIDGTVNMMAIASIEQNGSAFEKFAIISIFVAHEKCIVTPVPWKKGRYMKLCNFSNRLCLSMFVGMDFLVYSMEKKEETSWKWTNLMKFPIMGSSLIGNNLHLDDIICLKENGNILWRKIGGDFLEYNVKKEEETQFTLKEISPSAELSILYVESLASLRIPWD